MLLGFMYDSLSESTGSSTGKPPACHNAALHLLGALAEMGVAGVEVGPGVEDGDDRLALVVLAGVTHLLDARAVAELRRSSGPNHFQLRNSAGPMRFSDPWLGHGALTPRVERRLYCRATAPQCARAARRGFPP